MTIKKDDSARDLLLKLGLRKDDPACEDGTLSLLIPRDIKYRYYFSPGDNDWVFSATWGSLTRSWVGSYIIIKNIKEVFQESEDIIRDWKIEKLVND